ncbi:hypothetical protein [Moorena sp. SIOASIH]|nr:hypothetical protein [Moorena sp. SIOASIH]
MPVPPRCLFHKTLKIIPLLSNAKFGIGDRLTTKCDRLSCRMR